MKLEFVGRVGVERYIEGNETKERAAQHFRSGVLVAKGLLVKSLEGKKEVVKEVGLSFKPTEIGRQLEVENGEEVLARYPSMFKKA